MKKSVMFLVLASLAFVFSGCSGVSTIAKPADVMVNLSAADIMVGPMVEKTIPYDDKDSAMTDKVYAEAVKESGYDFLMFPIYEIKTSAGGDTITVRGYGAKIKK